MVGARHQEPHARRDRAEAPDDQPLGAEPVQHRIALEVQRIVVAVVVRVLADLDRRALHQRPQEHHPLLPLDRVHHRRIRRGQRHRRSLLDCTHAEWRKRYLFAHDDRRAPPPRLLLATKLFQFGKRHGAAAAQRSQGSSSTSARLQTRAPQLVDRDFRGGGLRRCGSEPSGRRYVTNRGGADRSVRYVSRIIAVGVTGSACARALWFATDGSRPRATFSRCAQGIPAHDHRAQAGTCSVGDNLVRPTTAVLGRAVGRCSAYFGAQLARRAAVGGAERAREVRRVRERPAAGDDRDRLVRERGVEQVAAAGLEAAVADPLRDADVLGREDACAGSGWR